MITKYYEAYSGGGSAPVDSPMLVKLKEYFKSVTPEQLIKDYESMGYKFESIEPSTPSPSLPSELKDRIETEAERYANSGNMLSGRDFLAGANFALSLNADQVEAKEGKGDEGWISVEDLPEKEDEWPKERVLAFDGHVMKVVTLYSGHIGILGYNTQQTDYMHHITHYRKLPNPPQV